MARLALAALALLAAAAAASPVTMSLSANATSALRAPSNYNMQTALSGVYFSCAAYCKPDDVKDWSCGPCKKSGAGLKVVDFFYVKKSDTNGFVAIDAANKRVVVAFMGSRDLKQWMYDLTFTKTKLDFPGASPNVEVHKGFYESYMDARDLITASVNSTLASNPGYSLFVTGHSLGAAISVFCTLDLTIQHPSVPLVHYCYGLPRVGNQAFSEYFGGMVKGTVYWHVHYRDPVPHLPLESMGFYHIQNQVFYKKDFEGESSLNFCTAEESDCSDQYDLDLNVDDHLNYLGLPLSSTAC